MKLVEKISRKFSKHEKQYDSNYEEPVIRCSICTGADAGRRCGEWHCGFCRRSGDPDESELLSAAGG